MLIANPVTTQYEVNGSTEIYDPAQPTTTACPYLPGQTVNSLYIPEERTLHSRSASTTNLVPELFRTMNPKDKYAPTRTAAQLEAGTITQRLHTATSVLSRSSPDRSPSPPSWRRFFSRREESRGRSASKPASVHNSLYTLEEDEPPAARSEGTRTRDISPESLRRFLCDDAIPSRPSSRFEVRFSMINMDDDVNDAVEDEEDDDNFASVASPTTPAFTFATRLSPPPTHRSNNSFTTVTAKTPRVTTSLPRLDTAIVAQETPFSSPEIPSFDDSGDDSHDEDSSAVKENMPFAYKLPVTFGKLGNATSPKLVGKTADVDDLSELGWMVGAISIGN